MWFWMFEILLPAFVLLFAFIVGRLKIKAHYKELIAREALMKGFPVIAIKCAPKNLQNCFLVTGSVVMSLDLFRQFLAFFRNIFGGNIRGYECLLERAKREAVLRMKEKAAQSGANIVFNIKTECAPLTNIYAGN